jgi:hypothetical protein
MEELLWRSSATSNFSEVSSAHGLSPDRVFLNVCISNSEGNYRSANLDSLCVLLLEFIGFLQEDQGAKLRPIVFDVYSVRLVFENGVAPGDTDIIYSHL